MIVPIIPDGEILPGSAPGLILGFTQERFSGYLWGAGDVVYVSLIISLQEGKGNLSALFDRILSLGFTLKVPTPSVRMIAILRKKGFEQTWEEDTDWLGPCEIWMKKGEECPGSS